MKTLSILALTGVLALSGACSRDIEKAPHAKKVFFYEIQEPKASSRIHPLEVNLSECKDNLDMLVTDIGKNKKNYSEFIHTLVSQAGSLPQTQHMLCSAKYVALQKKYEATFEIDFMKSLMQQFRSDLDDGKIYTAVDKLGYAIFLAEHVKPSVMHMLFSKPMKTMYEMMQTSIERGDMSLAVNLAPQYVDFSERIFDDTEKKFFALRTTLTQRAFLRVQEEIAQGDIEDAQNYFMHARELGNRFDINYDAYEEKTLLFAQRNNSFLDDGGE